MLLLGIDIGTSSVKASVLDASTQQCIASTTYPETEAPIISPHPGWAEQDPESWWEQVRQAIGKLHHSRAYDPKNIAAIGIAYQMHGLVMVDKENNRIRNSIIWCDSRAVETGDQAFNAIGKEKCLHQLLNSPGNFTASKLGWVKQNEPELYERIEKVMLPGDFIAMKLTGETTTSISALSEGIFWDFRENRLSEDVFGYFGFPYSFIPVIRNVFAEHGRLTNSIAAQLSLEPGIPVSYKAGDQPNNALSLNVFNPGEVAATAGTSGVIYAVTDQPVTDAESRINSFAHVNYTEDQKHIGQLLCINGTGIGNRWVRNISGNRYSYAMMNAQAATIAPGSEGLMIFPFGNGAERMLGNRNLYAHFQHIDFNRHSQAHIFRAVQEGIACSFRYGLDILRRIGVSPRLIRAGKNNLFLSEVFCACFADTLDTPLELYDTDGSYGAAIGAGLGAGIYSSITEAFGNLKPARVIDPRPDRTYESHYTRWREELEKQLSKN
jgi:xylulokinase